MVVALPRRAYGPPPAFGFQPVEDEYGIPQPPMPGVGGAIGVQPQPEEFEQYQVPQQGEPPQLIEPLPQQGAAQLDGGGMFGGDAPPEDFPTEATVERRQRLAKALMSQQQEVNHPMQAVANAVSQITGAWMERKAEKEQQQIETRRRDAFKKAFAGERSDLGALAEQLLGSDDPVLVDKGLEIKLALATRGREARKPPPTRTYDRGGEKVTEQWNEETGQFEPLATAPRYREDGGGGDGPRRQQAGAMQLPNGDVVPAIFNPGDGQYYYQSPEGTRPVPAGSRPVNPSTGGTLSAPQWVKLQKERQEGINALQAIDAYAKQAGGLPQGYRRWANEITAKWKTFLGRQGLTQAQFDQLQAPAKQQALLGMLRTTIVGPGVMTEYDAERIVQAMGGDPRSALQNPEVMAAILRDLYERKRNEVMVLQREYERNAPSFGVNPEPLPAPEHMGGGGGQSQTPRPELKDGAKVTKNGVTYERRNGRWFPVK